MTLDRLALNALSRLEQGSTKGRGGAASGERLPPGRHRAVFHGAPFAIVLVDARGCVRDANHEAQRLSRWTFEELRRTTLNALVRPDGKVRADSGARSWRGVLQGGDGSRIAVRVVQGASLGGADALSPCYLIDRGGEQAERELTRATDQVDAVATFAHGLALELANRLTALVGHAELLGQALEPGTPEHTRLGDALRSVEGLDGLARGLGSLGREEKPRVRMVDLASWLKGAEARIRARLAEGVGLELAVETAGLAVHADPHSLEQALLAMAAQACRAMPQGGLFGVAMVAGEDPDRVILEVRDTGSPLVPDRTEQVFLPFAPIREDGRDAGLDLAMARALLARSRLGVVVDAEVRDGLSFRVTLPKARLA